MKEDELTNIFVEENKGAEILDVEKEYNYYGSRGYVDFFVRTKDKKAFELGRTCYRDTVREIKTSPKYVDKCNDIVRQFKKMRNNFYKGTELSYHQSIYSHSVTFELCFAPTSKAIKHIRKNIAMYETLFNNGPDFSNTLICFRDVSNTMPVHIVTSGERINYLNQPWFEHAKISNKEVYNKVLEVAEKNEFV